MELGQTGTVIRGDMAGFSVRAEYSADTGGYYLYFSRDFV